MKQLLSALTIVACISHPASATEWLAAPSTYTHDPRTAERVTQYTPIGPVYAYPDPVQSAYRHVQSVIRTRDSADYLHIVEQWGQNPVRPYGEWQFPFRPYSVPYDLWGPQLVPPFAFPPTFPYPFPYPYPNPYPGPNQNFHPQNFHPQNFHPQNFHPQNFHPRRFPSRR